MQIKERHKKILKSILTYQEQHGYPPTVRELASMVNLKSSSTMAMHLSNLQNNGYLTSQESRPRTLKVLEKGLVIINESDSSAN